MLLLRITLVKIERNSENRLCYLFCLSCLLNGSENTTYINVHAECSVQNKESNKWIIYLANDQFENG